MGNKNKLTDSQKLEAIEIYAKVHKLVCAALIEKKVHTVQLLSHHASYFMQIDEILTNTNTIDYSDIKEFGACFDSAPEACADSMVSEMTKVFESHWGQYEH